MGYGGSILFIHASIISPVPDLVADLGGNVELPFRRAGVPIELASEPDRNVPMRDYLALLTAAARETGDEHFGVSLGERIKIDDLGPFGRLHAGAPTLRRSIETANALVHHFSPAMRCWLETESETARWYFRRAGFRDRDERFRIDGEYCLSACRTLIRLAAGPNWQPDEILVAQATPQELRALQSRIGVPVRCAGTDYALVFPPGLLGLPMTYAKPLGEAERQPLYDRLMPTAPDGSFVGSVKAIIRSQLSAGYPEISTVARSAGLSVRTFQRRLAEEGSVYSDLVAAVRRDLAREMLADPSQRQFDVAMSLGYADAANFSRAFRQWTGATPSEFRRALERAPAAVWSPLGGFARNRARRSARRHCARAQSRYKGRAAGDALRRAAHVRAKDPPNRTEKRLA